MLGLVVHQLDQQRIDLLLGLRDVGVQHLHELVGQPEVGVGHVQLLVEEAAELTVLVAGLQAGAGGCEVVEVAQDAPLGRVAVQVGRGATLF